MSNHLVNQLFDAYQTHTAVSFLNPEHAIDEVKGYQLQAQLVEKLATAHESHVRGYKVSMTSAETQAYANTHEPAYGTLLSHVFKDSQAHISLSNLFAPLIEPELVFVLTEDLSASPTIEEIVAASRIAPAIEIPDARYIDWFPNFTLGDLLADNTATGLLVIGTPISNVSVDTLGDITMTLKYNGEVTHTGHSTAVLGHPAKAVQWLAQKLSTHDKHLTKGMVISSGTFITPIPAQPGSYHIDYSGIGEVQATIEP